jgi:hypothetical protein
VADFSARQYISVVVSGREDDWGAPLLAGFEKGPFTMPRTLGFGLHASLQRKLCDGHFSKSARSGALGKTPKNGLTAQFYLGIGADTVMESISLIDHVTHSAVITVVAGLRSLPIMKREVHYAGYQERFTRTAIESTSL